MPWPSEPPSSSRRSHRDGKLWAAHYSELGAGLGKGSEQDPQVLAFLALFCMPFPLMALLQRVWLLPSFIVVGALTVEIVLSYVRAALVGSVLLLLIYIVVAARRRGPTAFALAGGFIVTVYVVQGRLSDRFSDLGLLFSGDAAGAGSNRVAIWTSVWEATTESIQTQLRVPARAPATRCPIGSSGPPWTRTTTTWSSSPPEACSWWAPTSHSFSGPRERRARLS